MKFKTLTYRASLPKKLLPFLNQISASWMISKYIFSLDQTNWHQYKLEAILPYTL